VKRREHRREKKLVKIACVAGGYDAGMEGGWVGPRRVLGVGRRGAWVIKNYVFGKNSPQIVIFMVVSPFCHHATLQVGLTWGVRWTRIRWEKFSTVFAPYSIDNILSIFYKNNDKFFYRS
jgi:hypothetical protein